VERFDLAPQPEVKQRAPANVGGGGGQQRVVARSGGVVVNPVQSKDRLAAEMAAEKALKYTMSALRFHDIGSAVENCKKALALLLPHQ
jgi:hypothetical protein